MIRSNLNEDQNLRFSEQFATIGLNSDTFKIVVDVNGDYVERPYLYYDEDSVSVIHRRI